jgi:hypothetical protein
MGLADVVEQGGETESFAHSFKTDPLAPQDLPKATGERELRGRRQEPLDILVHYVQMVCNRV